MVKKLDALNVKKKAAKTPDHRECAASSRCGACSTRCMSTAGSNPGAARRSDSQSAMPSTAMAVSANTITSTRPASGMAP